MPHALRLLLLAIVGIVIVAGARNGTSNGYPDMRRGVNLETWLRPSSEPPPTAFELRTLKRIGFTFARVPVAPDPSMTVRGDLRPEARVALQSAVRSLLAAGLDVVVDLHPVEDAGNRAYGVSASYRARYSRLVVTTAAALRQFPLTRVALELRNEPHPSDPDLITHPWRWPEWQLELVRAVRSVSQTLTLVVTADHWSSPEELRTLPTIPDRHVVYTFHDYEPFAFTHQGATWTSPTYAWLRSVPYPPTPEGMAAARQQSEDVAGDLPRRAAVDLILDEYALANWNRDRVNQQMAGVGTWAKRHHARVLLGEFGVYRRYAPRADAMRLLGDIRSASEQNNIGWAVWFWRSWAPAGAKPSGDLRAALFG